MTGNTNSIPSLDADSWRREEPLSRAAEVVEQSGGRIRVVSFDFFDTIVWRLTGKPTDVFKEVAGRLLGQDLLRAEISPADYEVLRRHAEMRTRHQQNLKDATREDIGIAEIYGNLQALFADPERPKIVEHETECDLCILNPMMAGFIHHLAARGLKVIVVSDIYFSAEQLKGILKANHFDPGIFDLVLTSADAGVCKGTGNLFKRALETLKLEASQVVHIGDNYHPDVIGARNAGVRGFHYLQTSIHTRTILERERFLLGAQDLTFSANSLRTLAARLFPGDSDEAFFSRMGALIMGPILTRFAAWACGQFVAAGVRKVGAFMREGELLGELLRREAAAGGHDLEVTPLYVNRKATGLAAIGQLTAESIMAWLEARNTLPIKTIVEHFGLTGETLRKLPFSLEEKADKPDKIIKLARFLFAPEIAARIEAKSAEERRTIVKYLEPWLKGGDVFGVCDIGYSASAQTQVKRLLDLEGIQTRMVGCYLVSYERAADRVLDGVDIRSFLGAFGYPEFYYRAFIRGPAFIEQSITAACGTTLGYERKSDGSVEPILDPTPYDEKMLQRQRAFKNGVLEFQKLWIWTARHRPGLLDGRTALSKRILADVDRGFAPILARASSFPTKLEVSRFGALALDDYYFKDSYKPLCGDEDREALRKFGFGRLLGESGVHWPHGVLHMENPQSASQFFSLGRATLLCDPTPDGDALDQLNLTVILPAGRSPHLLRECLNRLKTCSCPQSRFEIAIIATEGDKDILAVAREFARDLRLHVLERNEKQKPNEMLNLAADNSAAPLLMFLDEGTLLPRAWDSALLKTINSSPDIGIVLPRIVRTPKIEDRLAATLRGFVIRRAAFIEGLGFDSELSPVGGAWKLALKLRELNWKIEICSGVPVEIRPAEIAMFLPGFEKSLLAKSHPDFAEFATGLSQQVTVADSPAPQASTAPQDPPVVDWIGSFLDAGSLSNVNRELTNALAATGGIKLNRIAAGAEISPAFKDFGRELSRQSSADAAITVRHAWPPDWTRPKSGKLVVIQPWEFGALPEQWVKNAAGVDEFWVPSEYVRRVYIESGVAAAKVAVVPNGVDKKRFHPEVAPLPLATGKKFKFLFVGGTIFRKGPDVLLKAYLENFTAADDVCLIIKDFGGKSVYAGQTFEAKIRAAQSLPGAPEILYLNEELAPDSLPGLYAACNCLVLPYRGEGFGLPVIEAMACGLPVIVTAGGATDDFVRDDFALRIPSERRIFGNEIAGMKLANPGWLLEPDAAVLGRHMKALAAQTDEARNRGRLARQHAVQFYSWDAAAQAALKRINALAAQSTPLAVSAASSKPVRLDLPPCALVGHLAEARQQFEKRKLEASWKSTLAALAARPHHPEAALLLAEIAQTAGDSVSARHCAQHARKLAPDWKPVKRFLKANLRGNQKHTWLVPPPSISNPSENPKLSVCLIVKNEEKFLGRCLASIRELASQIIVVDTGSTDRTVEIAREAGAEVHSFAWADDFSAARNEALKFATGDWILSLDADEELLPEHRQTILQEIKAESVLAYRLPIIDCGREREGCSYVPRLYRNAPGLFYVGRIHEQVLSSLEVRRREWGLENRLGKSALLHHGYTSEVVADRNKIERNLRLLELAIEELPGEPNLLMNLGLELLRSGRRDEGLQRYREAYDAMVALPAAQIVPELRETLLTQYSTHLFANRRFADITRLWATPFAKSTPMTASQHFLLGLANMEVHQPAAACEQFRQCLAKRGSPALTPVNAEILGAAPNHCLALALAAQKDAAAAAEAFGKALADDPKSRPARFDFARFLADQGKPLEALKLLNELVAEDPRQPQVWQLGAQIAVSRPQFLKFACDWTGEALKHHPQNPALVTHRAEALLLSQQTDAALALWNGGVIPPSPHQTAAVVLCEAADGNWLRRIPATEELYVSQELLKWCLSLKTSGAHSLVSQVSENLDNLRAIVPSFVRAWETAMQAPAETVA